MRIEYFTPNFVYELCTENLKQHVVLNPTI